MNNDKFKFFLDKIFNNVPVKSEWHIFFFYRAWLQFFLNFLLWYSVGDHFMTYAIVANFLFGLIFIIEHISFWWFKTPYKKWNNILDCNIFNLPLHCSLPLFFSFYIYLNIFEKTYLFETNYDGTSNWLYIFTLRLFMGVFGLLLLSGEPRLKKNLSRI